MRRQEDFIEAGIQYRFAHGTPMAIGGGHFAEMTKEMNRTKPFEAGAEWADQHPNWIPVEERLPEVGEKVIFYSPDLDDWLSGALQQDGTWWNEEYGTHFYDVTHWMEIVPPRKEEKI